MSRQTQAAIDAYLAALVAREDIAPFFADDAVLTLVEVGQETRGREAVAGAIADLHQRTFDARPEVLNLVVGEGKAAGEFVFAGTHTGDFVGIPATGRSVRVPYTVFYDLEGGRITALRFQGFASGLGAQLTAEATPAAGAPTPWPDPAPGGAMTPDEHKAISRRTAELINRRDLDALDPFFAPGYVDRTAPPGEAGDLAGLKRSFAAVIAAFPDLRITVEDQVAEGDRVVDRFTDRGTHRGEFLGVAPTGRAVTIAGVAIHRFVDGKIAESWFYVDALDLLRQLGTTSLP